MGDHFTSKAVMLEWRKICNGFAKRIDSKLPFFYYTSTHDRFYEGEMQSFDVQGSKKSTLNPRNQRGRSRTVEQPGKLASERASLIRTGHGSIRRQFHAVPTDMPLPPTATLEELISNEHAYTRLFVSYIQHTITYRCTTTISFCVYSKLIFHLAFCT